MIMTIPLSSLTRSNGYYKNHAVFNFTDDLVLNDGVLWDYRMSNAVHKFDKLNNFVSGVFSPSGKSSQSCSRYFQYSSGEPRRIG